MRAEQVSAALRMKCRTEGRRRSLPLMHPPLCLSSDPQRGARGSSRRLLRCVTLLDYEYGSFDFISRRFSLVDSPLNGV